MKRLVLCMVSVERSEYMRGRSRPEEVLKQVWVDEDHGENVRYVLDRHYEDLSDPYGTSFSVVAVDEVETIGDPS